MDDGYTEGQCVDQTSCMLDDSVDNNLIASDVDIIDLSSIAQITEVLQSIETNDITT